MDTNTDTSTGHACVYSVKTARCFTCSAPRPCREHVIVAPVAGHPGAYVARHGAIYLDELGGLANGPVRLTCDQAFGLADQHNTKAGS